MAIWHLTGQRLWVPKLTAYSPNLSGLPRLYGTFRYSADQDISHWAFLDGDTFDAAFDVHYQILATKNRVRPRLPWACADFLRTGILSSEYFVATKSCSKLESNRRLRLGPSCGSEFIFEPVFSGCSERFDYTDAGLQTLAGSSKTATVQRFPPLPLSA